MRRIWALWITLLVVTAAATAGCAGSGGDGIGGPGDDPDRLRKQARDALARYDEAVRTAGGQQRFVPVGDLTGQVGDWEAGREENKASLLAGQVVAGGALPAPPQATGTVTWDGGATLDVPLVGAEASLAAIPRGDCGGCPPLTVTGARLTTAKISTTRGPATVPAWEYTLRDTAVRVTRPAVAASAAVTVTPPSWDPFNAPGGLPIDSASVNAAGTTLTVVFVGSQGPASVPCGADYTGEVVESANAVVVIIVTHPHAADEACTAIGFPRTLSVELAAPLGERALLDIQQGLPIAVTRS
ncbi:hypothetical protein KZZ52_40170 [Dactylosporangium sp. AC04546]|uniref:hypothetical protein n=1 Tax=Dactylosporangium sp. AC04546 TaxID=2862460 RepID=UPI001EDEDD28|nr:hypothetical protein [Dactylosporangium sp. AC04546]WVK80164.1 hypothetical protein KZZ52_40170 [Dactylosporangium sp. AC04546]